MRARRAQHAAQARQLLSHHGAPPPPPPHASQTAVALGMRAALELSVRHLGLDPSVPRLAEEALKPAKVRVDIERAWESMKLDKKSEAGKTRLVLLQSLGHPVWGVELPDAEVREALESLVER